MFVGLPSFYGAWLHLVFNLTQHAGLAEDVLDHRLNTRTVYLNPIFRFIYWNMNYHVEHHMFPMAPYHALPALHQAIKADTPPAYRSLWEAYREIVPTLLRQRKDPSYFVVRKAPLSGCPYPQAKNCSPCGGDEGCPFLKRDRDVLASGSGSTKASSASITTRSELRDLPDGGQLRRL